MDAVSYNAVSIALAAEKDTVFFYTFLREYVPTSQGRAKVEAILEGETRHIALLTREVGGLSEPGHDGTRPE